MTRKRASVRKKKVSRPPPERDRHGTRSVKANAMGRSDDALLAAVIDLFPGAVARIDRELRFRFVSAGYERLMGLSPQSIVGRRMPDFLDAASRQRFGPYIRRALAGERVSFDSTIRSAAGEDVTASVTLIPERDPHGEVSGFLAIRVDQ